MTEDYERLSAMESALLSFETPTNHMHLGVTAIFDAGPLRERTGAVDSDRVRRHVAARLSRLPRYRQKLAWIPIENHPVWIDAEHLDLTYHIRHVALPKPGDDAQLKQLAGDIISRPLDRTRPLWEIWLIDGLVGGRVALVAKVHHCLADGASGVDALFSVVMSPVPEPGAEAGGRRAGKSTEPDAVAARPAPSAVRLVRDAVLRRARLPFDVVRDVGAALLDPARGPAGVLRQIRALYDLVTTAVPGPAETPLNGPNGVHRRFDWHALDLADVKAVKNRLGGSINDVALATVAGGIAEFFKHRRLALEGRDVRVMIPASTRIANEAHAAGVRVSGWLASLPLDERNPRRRYARVRAATTHLKETRQALGPELLFQAGDVAGPPFSVLGTRIAAWLRPYNMIVTNVPGPQVPFFLLGAPLREVYPVCPLFERQAIAVAVLSYNGTLFIGINADRDLVPDLAVLTDGFALAFRRLHAAATATRGRRIRRRQDGAPLEDTTVSISALRS
jgi:WS/DGAT/MGAT family acyltransferase